MTRYLPKTLIVMGALTLAAAPARAAWDDWNCNLRAHWGALDGLPQDTTTFLGVRPGATDGYDAMDSMKPAEPLGHYVYAWFSRPDWGVGLIMHDWRAPIAEGASKRWGASALKDTWNVKTNFDNGWPSGYFDPVCDPWHELEYPVAASIYVSWQFGVGYEPPAPLPPDDYTFTLIYRGGISPKPPGTKLPDAMDPPPVNTQWDMDATDYIVIPLWQTGFTPWREDCSDFGGPDTAKFLIVASNPDTIPTCTISVAPSPPQRPPATFTFTAVVVGDEPFICAWDFGDGETGTGSPTSHTYDDVGTYAVTCSVTDVNGDATSCATEVEVAGPVKQWPTCAITYEPAGPMINEWITFHSGATDPDGLVVSVNWQFGDGHVASGDPATHRYAIAATYTVSVTVCDDDGLCTTCTAAVTIDQPPTCHITHTPSVPRVAEEVNFDSHAEPASGVAAVYWYFGDGSMGTGLQVTHAYKRYREAPYPVTCTVIDRVGRTYSCQTAVAVQMAFSLQWALDRLGYTVNVPAYYSGQKIDPKGYRQSTGNDAIEAGAFFCWGSGPPPPPPPPGAAVEPNVQATLQARSSGLASTFGHFRTTRTPLLFMPEWEWWIDPDGPTCSFCPSSAFGLYIDVPPWVFAADVAWPPDGFDYFILLPAKVGGFWVGDGTTGRWEGAWEIPHTYLCCWEDWKDAGVGGDADFQDVIIRLSGVGVLSGPPASVYGQVRRAWDGRPVASADVCVRLFSDASWQVKTDKDGWYRIDRVAHGARALWCTASAYHRYDATIEVPVGGSLRKDIDLVPICGVSYWPPAPTTDDVVTFSLFIPAPGPMAYWATWQFGDGHTGTDGDIIGHQYAMPKTYRVTVTACGQAGPCTTCTATVVVGKGANIPPVCEVTYEPANPRTGDDIVFHANASDPNPWGAIVSYQWDFGDGGTAAGDPAGHVYADPGVYTVCVTVTDDQGGQTTCCTQVVVTLPCYCDLAIDPTHCKMPAGRVGQCKTGQIGARNMSFTEPCDVLLRVTDNAGSVVFETTQTIGPGRGLRVRFPHCYTADEIGKNLWAWEVQPLGCGERDPWNNVRLRKVIVHP